MVARKLFMFYVVVMIPMGLLSLSLAAGIRIPREEGGE